MNPFFQHKHKPSPLVAGFGRDSEVVSLRPMAHGPIICGEHVQTLSSEGCRPGIPVHIFFLGETLFSLKGGMVGNLYQL